MSEKTTQVEYVLPHQDPVFIWLKEQGATINGEELNPYSNEFFALRKEASRQMEKALKDNQATLKEEFQKVKKQILAQLRVKIMKERNAATTTEMGVQGRVSTQQLNEFLGTIQRLLRDESVTIADIMKAVEDTHKTLGIITQLRTDNLDSLLRIEELNNSGDFKAMGEELFKLQKKLRKK